MEKFRLLRWTDIDWKTLAETLEHQNPPLLIPVGSVEQHGPHLPLLADTLIPQGIIERLPARLEHSVVMGVPISHTYAPESELYPGTLSLRGTSLVYMIADVMASYQRHPFPLIGLLNGHMESYQFLLEGIRMAAGTKEARTKVLLINWWDLVTEETLGSVFPGGWPGWEAEHAALIETSLMLTLCPKLVDTDNIPETKTFHKKPYQIHPIDRDHKPPSGSFASPKGSSVEIGEAIESVAQYIDKTRIH